MLITSGYPLSMQVDPVAGQIILDALVRHGLTVEVGVSVTAFEGNGRGAIGSYRGRSSDFRITILDQSTKKLLCHEKPA
ncbi:hypothetical protein DSCOOX_35840 [Desulfosarcina ovata subsp. ovata]|uniref:Uncharacterized protein n=1 Tax=Desulfosarcina ovata subsp. ovata TaxID=2752305 RepID=A0A5K8AEJ2_9BACT|nr:hypothetical protein DSCOOX_35840 [Desulfosarcina ovata subsp. ovata]